MTTPRSLSAELRRPILLGMLIAFAVVLVGVLALGGSLPIAVVAGLGIGVFVGGGIGLLWAARASGLD